MKKKIAILTQPLGHNYGGIIQNYALQKVLIDMGYEVETIAREYTLRSKRKKLLSKIKNETYNRLRGKYRKVFSAQEIEYITSSMTRFISENILLSEKIYSTEELKNYIKRNGYEVIIVGSDQTWRPKYSPNIYNYYLDFLEYNSKIIKIAYASSFGTDKWEYSEEQSDNCKRLIKSFDAVSVREQSGVNMCKNYFDLIAEWVADPTLLLSISDYKKMFKKTSLKQNRLFNYVLDKEKQKQDFIREVANILNIETYTNQPTRSLDDVCDYDNIENYIYPSIEDWVQSFYDAKFVITDSFHGTVFSIIFNKPFLAVVNEARGASRFYSLLEYLGLEDRLITDVSDFNYNLLNQEINYNEVNDKLKIFREKSLQFLKDSII